MSRIKVQGKYRAYEKVHPIAYDLGIPCIRLNSGTWGTVRGFSKLMELRGQEPVLEGYTLDDGFNWCIESIEKCLRKRKS